MGYLGVNHVLGALSCLKGLIRLELKDHLPARPECSLSSVSNLPVGPYLSNLLVLSLQSLNYRRVPPEIAHCTVLHTLCLERNGKLELGTGCQRVLLGLPQLRTLCIRKDSECGKWWSAGSRKVIWKLSGLASEGRACFLKCPERHGLQSKRLSCY